MKRLTDVSNGIRGDLPRLATPAIAVLVCLGYWLGARVGSDLRFPPATTSVLWPPNAILTATLLLTKPSRWWIYLLAVFPAHLAVELPLTWPTLLVLTLFVTNCLEAVLAAGAVHRFSNAPSRFDTLERMTIFIVGAAIAAPFFSSFADAAAVAALRNESFWQVWQTRFHSNVLTELVLVPTIVMLITDVPGRVRTMSLPRALEAMVLVIGLVVVGWASFGQPGHALGTLSETNRTPLVLLLPFLLWAAVRFGPWAVSLSLLSIVLLAIDAEIQGHGPFMALPPSDSVRALQIFGTYVTIPLLCLAAVIEERRRAQEKLLERLQLERLLTRLSGAFVHLPEEGLDSAIRKWLERLGEHLGLDRVVLGRFTEAGDELRITHSWASSTSPPLPSVMREPDYPWTFDRLRREELVSVSRTEDLPPAAARDEASLRHEGIRSQLLLPLVSGGRPFGGLGFATLGTERVWTAELVQQLELVSQVFANTLARRDAEDARRFSEVMKSAILASLTSNVAVVDRHGVIVATNPNWDGFVSENHSALEGGVVAGANYLEVCRASVAEGVAHAAQVLTGIEDVLNGRSGLFVLEYRIHSPRFERWISMTIVPLRRPEGGAVISSGDISERKRAELEAQRSRDQLSRFTRVSTMGELAGSLSHQLSQPLTAILTNAQAALHFLDAGSPDLEEVRSIMSDIVADDTRAREVIQRLRELLQKGELERAEVDVNSVILDVANLLNSDAIIRGIKLVIAIDPTPKLVLGDRVQLEQVVLNLLINAMDAMSEAAPARSRVVLRTEGKSDGRVHVSVEDEGSGIAGGQGSRIFEPFYTTKMAGMGLGLSVARSIVEAHGGRIWASDNLLAGTTFHFTLPLAVGDGDTTKVR